jgi:hypothetical protein
LRRWYYFFLEKKRLKIDSGYLIVIISNPRSKYKTVEFWDDDSGEQKQNKTAMERNGIKFAPSGLNG